MCPCVQQLQLPRFKNINIQVLLFFFFFLSNWAYISKASEFNFATLLNYTNSSLYHMDSW